MEQLAKLFNQFTGKTPSEISELPSSGSNRRYFRLFSDNLSLIGVKGTSVEENMAFYKLSLHFTEKGLPVPRVLAHNEEFTCYIQEDLGDKVLYDAVSNGRERGVYNDAERKLLNRTIAMLPRLQFEGAQGLDFSVCYPQPEFDERMISFDLNYFKYCFLKATGPEFNEVRLDDDFKKLGEILLRDSYETFLYRDFQARNVMLVENNPYFIDFQGGRKGPIYYDLASFVWQAKSNYSEQLKKELIETYLFELKKYVTIEESYFYNQLRHFVLFRTLQVLGAYGFRGYFEKKPHFLQSVPFAIFNLKHLLTEPFSEYPYLYNLLLELTQLKQFSDINVDKRLEIKIYSFAYKKGVPEDNSGNGGGYVFDCRGLLNPGKYEHYFHFTGMDKEVIEFMENDGGVFKFLDNVYSLADTHIERYIQRKFTNLMFSFGCTGGQHRSVYCAEHLADHIRAKYDVKVSVYHREQNIEKEYS